MTTTNNNSIHKIQQTNILISALSGSEYFASEYSRRILVRSNFTFSAFNALLVVFLLTEEFQSTLPYVIGLLVVNSILCLFLAWQASHIGKIPPSIHWLKDSIIFITVLFAVFLEPNISFYYLVVSLFYFFAVYSIRKATLLSIFSILGFAFTTIFFIASLNLIEISLKLFVSCMVLLLVGYLRANLDQIVHAAKNITESLEEVSSDLSDRLHNEKNARIQAEDFDLESGLHNLGSFQKILERELFLNSLNKSEIRVECIINLYINSLENHTQTLSLGNQNLLFSEIGFRLNQMFKDQYLIGRSSKNEFVLFDQKRESNELILEHAQRAQSELQRPFIIDGLPIYLDIKCGVAQEVVRDADQLLRHAQIASLYSIEQNINTPMLFDSMFEEIVARNDAILRQIRGAIADGSFELYLQPIIDLSSKQILKAEALVRLKDLDGSYISPAQFIPLAERNGLVNDITRWMIRKSCKRLATLRQEFHPDFQLSINISPFDLQNPIEFLNLIDDVVIENKIPYEAITLEITEGIFLDITSPVKDVFKTLKEIGVKISLDDFGTGYSSLSYLDQLPIDFLKIDRSFIDEISVKSNKYAICKGIIDISHSLGIQVVAEGIETVDQMNLLEKISCDFGQGYLFSKPVDEELFLEKVSPYFEK